ncbi:MAG TPA: hypothetical protein VLE69_01535 [Candidatus Saccharimonadales bacterium]|nr:hypothetical protein [Candidatus Saccharimonadales bacterium]
MISASIGSHRFETGPSYHFNGSNLEQLYDVIADPTATMEYVNTLPEAEATPAEIREVAASGIVRLAVKGSNMDLLQRSSNALVDVCAGGTIDSAGFMDRYSRDVFKGEALNNHVLDSASVLATRKNKPAETAGIIEEKAPTDEGYFVIALANGGLISAANTYIHLSEGNHSFGAVRYSRHKKGEDKPNMHPYPDQRKAWLEREAEGRQVVVVDEDYGTGQTLRTATNYFANLLEKEVLGVAPVEVERRITYNPLVIQSDAQPKT